MNFADELSLMVIPAFLQDAVMRATVSARRGLPLRYPIRTVGFLIPEAATCSFAFSMFTLSYSPL